MHLDNGCDKTAQPEVFAEFTKLEKAISILSEVWPALAMRLTIVSRPVAPKSEKNVQETTRACNAEFAGMLSAQTACINTVIDSITDHTNRLEI